MLIWYFLVISLSKYLKHKIKSLVSFRLLRTEMHIINKLPGIPVINICMLELTLPGIPVFNIYMHVRAKPTWHLCYQHMYVKDKPTWHPCYQHFWQYLSWEPWQIRASPAGGQKYPAQKYIWIMGRIWSCGFLRIFTYNDDCNSKLGYTRVNECRVVLEPNAGARKRRKATLKKLRCSPLRILSLILNLKLK